MREALGYAPLGGDPLGRALDFSQMEAVIGTSSHLNAGLPSNAGYTPSRPVIAHLFAWGGGASGTSSTTLAERLGGGGGAAGYSRVVLGPSDRLTWSAGGAVLGVVDALAGIQGQDSYIEINGARMTAQGGRRPSYPTPAGQAIATGFQINRRGGGGAGIGGEGGGPSNSEVADGQGAGGFNDIFGAPTASRGQSGIVGNGSQIIPDFGAGGGATHGGGGYSTWGGPGRVLIILCRT